LRAILEDTHVLERLIDDLRTISVAEAGALALHREDTDLAELVRDTVASFGSMASSAGVALTVEAAGITSASVDPIRVREVLTNIVANALRYTPRGGSVSVTVTPWPEKITVAVRDSGEGIAAEVLPHVFDRFTRSPESPGAGLGLAIAKSLVTAHGGTIEVTSTPGQGTEIRFALPRTPAEEPV
jgi:two-component system sensor histidine kinase BaeS